MPEVKHPRCKRCKYQADMNSWHNCDYCFFVGASRSAQVEDPDDLLPSRCPFFAEGARLQKEDSYWWEMVNRTYPASIRKDEEKDETD